MYLKGFSRLCPTFAERIRLHIISIGNSAERSPNASLISSEGNQTSNISACDYLESLTKKLSEDLAIA